MDTGLVSCSEITKSLAMRLQLVNMDLRQLSAPMHNMAPSSRMHAQSCAVSAKPRRLRRPQRQLHRLLRRLEVLMLILVLVMFLLLPLVLLEVLLLLPLVLSEEPALAYRLLSRRFAVQTSMW
jgi:hypothetical protein